MLFTQELTCRWSTSTWTPTRVLPARSFAQKLLHRSCYTGVQLTSSDQIVCELLQNQTSPVLLFLSGGSDSQAVAYETLPSAACRIPKRVAKCGVLFVLGPAATVCGDRDRAGRTSKHVAKCKFGRARRSPFARNEGQPSKTGVFWKFRCKRGMKAKRQ